MCITSFLLINHFNWLLLFKFISDMGCCLSLALQLAQLMEPRFSITTLYVESLRTYTTIWEMEFPDLPSTALPWFFYFSDNLLPIQVTDPVYSKFNLKIVHVAQLVEQLNCRPEVMGSSNTLRTQFFQTQCHRLQFVINKNFFPETVQQTGCAYGELFLQFLWTSLGVNLSKIIRLVHTLFALGLHRGHENKLCTNHCLLDKCKSGTRRPQK